MISFLDSSLIVSLYVIDANSDLAAKAVTSIDSAPVITHFCELEVVNAFALREFRRECSNVETQRTIQNFEEDVRIGAYLVRPVPQETFHRAREISWKTTPLQGVRSADILHVASALEFGATHFFSFDIQQRQLAKTLGLELNPFRH
jgi:predicted nucleic acid-binding protein